MDLSVIIVNWNTKDLLKGCLYSIKKNTDNNRVKVIVVDNASSDGSRKMVQTLFNDVVLINSGGNIGFAKANNLAIPNVNTPFILFLNPDTQVEADTIDAMIKFIKENPSIGALGCKMKSPLGVFPTDKDAHGLGLQWFPSPMKELLTILLISEKTVSMLRRYFPYHDPNISGYVSKLYGGCLMVRKEVLDQIGYFDERFFMYCEDVDLCKRIIEGGWKLFYMSEVEIIHLVGGATSRASDHFSTLMMCESVSKMIEKYYKKRGKLFYRLAVFSGSYVRLFILILFKIISMILFPNILKIDYKKSFSKYIMMIKWSLNLQKPIIKN